MSQVSKPFTHVAGTLIEASKVNANDDAIFNDHNGNITDFNISATANINQSKILNLTADLNTIRNQKVQEVNILLFGTSGTYTKPSDLLFARVLVIGGGGGGGCPAAASSTFRAGGGGGGGGYAESWLMASAIGISETVTVGAGGAGGFNGQTGGNGGTSSFGSLVVASGGIGGNFAIADSNPANGNGGGGGSTGQIMLNGTDGSHGMALSTYVVGGDGGASPFGGGGQGAFGIGTAGQNGKNYGGGAGGGASSSGTPVTGGTGGGGAVIVFEYKA